MDFFHRHLESDADRDGSGRVKHVVRSGNMQAKLAQRFAVIGNFEHAAGRVVVGGAVAHAGDLKIRTFLHAVGHHPALNARRQLAQAGIVVAQNH